jgi:hypothetical protein
MGTEAQWRAGQGRAGQGRAGQGTEEYTKQQRNNTTQHKKGHVASNTGIITKTKLCGL